MPTVYCASKARYARWWQALRAAGVPIVASWIDWAPNHDGREPTAEQWRHHWFDCIEQAAGADIALFVNNADETACGALAEAGAALGVGKQVFWVSADWFSLTHHPRVRVFPTVAEAVAAILAIQSGERARAQALK